MEIKVGPAGKISLEQAPQQVWHGEEPDIMQISRFAGQEMMMIQKSDNEPDIYELHYMGFVATGFKGAEIAKSNALEFARKVLSRMADLIAG